jgi:type IV pilus assembly protein PilW
MVGLVVGMIGMLVMAQIYSAFEGQKRTTAAGGDAQTNGAMALYSIEREVRAAGNGITEGEPQKYPPLAGCLTHVFDGTAAYLIPDANAPYATVAAGGSVSSVRFAPAVISDGGGGLSDALTIVYGTATIVAPYILNAAYTPGNATINLTSAAGINSNDMVALIEKSPVAALSPSGNYITPTTCSLLQVTGAPVGGAVPVAINRYNKAGGTGLPVFSDEARLYDLGQLNIVTYRVANNNLVADITRFGVVPNGGAGQAINNRTDFAPLASNIVNMQVQYGVDTNNPMGPTQTDCKTNSPGTTLQNTDSDAIVDAWVDATAGTQWSNNKVANTPSLFDLRRVRAVRVGLVARSSIKASGKAGDTCDTLAAPVIHWDSGPNMTPDLSADPDWQCYRYKVYQTTIPIRNALWSSTMNPASSATCGLRDPA